MFDFFDKMKRKDDENVIFFNNKYVKQTIYIYVFYISFR